MSAVQRPASVPPAGLYARVRSAFASWLFQLRGPHSGTVVLVQRRIFILPTAQGLLFAGVLILMLVGSINYALSLGFVLTFLLTALALNAMVYTFRNVARLRVSAGRVEPVFVGERARFPIHIENRSLFGRYAIGVTADKREAVYVDVPAGKVVTPVIGLAAPRRGRLRPGHLTLFSRYPLGIYYAWSYLEFDSHCLVYPAPAVTRLPLPVLEPAAGSGSQQGHGHEDFAGLRQYHPGDSPRHIAWKAAARDQNLLTKQFSGQAETELWLDWSALPARLGVEERLSHLTRWILDAHAAGLAFGLRIPGMTVPPGSDRAQRDRCLEALALFGLDDA